IVSAHCRLWALLIDEPISPTNIGARFSVTSQPQVSFRCLIKAGPELIFWPLISSGYSCGEYISLLGTFRVTGYFLMFRQSGGSTTISLAESTAWMAFPTRLYIALISRAGSPPPTRPFGVIHTHVPA